MMKILWLALQLTFTFQPIAPVIPFEDRVYKVNTLASVFTSTQQYVQVPGVVVDVMLRDDVPGFLFHIADDAGHRLPCLVGPDSIFAPQPRLGVLITVFGQRTVCQQVTCGNGHTSLNVDYFEPVE